MTPKISQRTVPGSVAAWWINAQGKGVWRRARAHHRCDSGKPCQGVPAGARYFDTQEPAPGRQFATSRLCALHANEQDTPTQ